MYRPESDPPAVLHDVSLATRTTLRLGGPAQFYATANHEEELMRLLRWANGEGHPVTVLGGGSNVVIGDQGVQGLVIENNLRRFDFEPKGADRVALHVGAGEPWDTVVARAVAANCSGIECLSGIPGLAGATPIQNVGAYGQEVAQTIDCIRVFDRSNETTAIIQGTECEFAYRDSTFRQIPDRWIVVELTLILSLAEPVIPRYGELVQSMHGARHPSVAMIRDHVLELRRRKSMVLDPANPNTQSAGSFFTNPVVPEAQWAALEALAKSPVPHFRQSDGRVKVPAAWLIEHSGFPRGTRRGAIGISTDHALALVHFGGGTTSGLLTFAAEIRGRVHERFGITLEPEPVLWGARWPWQPDSEDPTPRAAPR